MIRRRQLRSRLGAALLLGAALPLGGCGNEPEPPAAHPAAPVTVTAAGQRDIPVHLEAVGRIETRTAPTVAAEVPGRIARVYVEAGTAVEAGTLLAEIDSTQLALADQAARDDAAALRALRDELARKLERYRELAAGGHISRDQLDGTEAQHAALVKQAAAAEARHALARDRLAKARIVAPVAGTVQARYVSPGDFLDEGMPAFLLSSAARFTVHLPFPESAAPRLAVGQPVTLESPLAPDAVVEAHITELRPQVSAGARAVEALIELDNPGGWRSGGSVTGRVTIERRTGAVVVPEQSVVLRPAGEVVYIIADGHAQARPVVTGARVDGLIEIRSGLDAGAVVAVDGAGFLADATPVRVRDAAP